MFFARFRPMDIFTVDTAAANGSSVGRMAFAPPPYSAVEQQQRNNSARGQRKVSLGDGVGNGAPKVY